MVGEVEEVEELALVGGCGGAAVRVVVAAVVFGQEKGGVSDELMGGQDYARLRRGFQEGETARGTVGGVRALRRPRQSRLT